MCQGIMATSPEDIDVVDTRDAGKAKLAIVPLLLAVVMAVVVSVLLLGGIGYYLMRSGRLGSPAVAAPAVVKVEVPVVPTTHALVLEPLVVNLADAGGKTYLRVGLTLRVVDAEPKKGDKPKEEKSKEAKGANEAEAAVRDTTLEVFGRETAAGLLAADGKNRLKTELKAALVQRTPDLKVADVFFTEFLVQQ